MRDTLQLIAQASYLPQGLPLGSGLGSSAASAAAAAVAVNALFGDVLPEQQLVLAGLKSEGTVSGYHADNIAPAIMGGFTLVRWASGALLTIEPQIVDEWRQSAARDGLHAVSHELLSATCVLTGSTLS